MVTLRLCLNGLGPCVGINAKYASYLKTVTNIPLHMAKCD